MGISQLLPFLEASTRNCHISEFRGRRVAVDAYCWLHKGARGCALKLVMGQETTAYVDYCMKYVNLLLQYDIKPIMVFDGRHLPAKATTESKRVESKKVARTQGMQLVSLGKSVEAYKFFCQCIDVTPQMAFALIKRLRDMKIDCIVAPYEADAQLAFFSINNIVDLVITEDSDLLLFGCKQVLYKLDTAGTGRLVDSDLLHVSMKMHPNKFTLDKFRNMCILSGCDYLESLPGIGLKKALKFISLTVENKPEIFLDRVPRYLKMFHLTVTPQYKENFLIAEATFKHQTIFDTRYNSLAPLTQIPPESQIHCVNAGEIFDNDAAIHIAWGNLNPLTMERLDDWYPNEDNTCAQSIWRADSVFTVRAPLVPNPSSLNQSQFSPRKSLNNSLILKAQIQKADQIEKELQFYKTPVSVEPVVTEHKTSNSPQKSPQKSPVLNNPFFKKKLFRVVPPKNGCNQKVISRFFSNVVGSSYRETTDSSSSSSLPVSEDLVDDDDENLSELEPPTQQAVPELDTSSFEEDVCPNMHLCKVLLVVDDTPIYTSDGAVPSTSATLETNDSTVSMVTQSGSSTSCKDIPPERPQRKRKAEPAAVPKKKKCRQLGILEIFKKMDVG